MARVTATEVKALLPTSISDGDVDTFINIANRYVNDVLGSASLTTAQKKDVELFLSAHFLATRAERGTPRYEQLGDSRVSWETSVGPGLQATRFGQRAVELDTTGTLRRAGGRGKASFKGFGTTHTL